MSLFLDFMNKICCCTRDREPEHSTIRPNPNKEDLFSLTFTDNESVGSYVSSECFTEEAFHNAKLPGEIEKLQTKRTILKHKINRAWTPDEDRLLSEAVSRFKGRSWKQIASCLSGRTASQCSQRWRRLQPRKLRKPWTKAEDAKLIKLVDELGGNWSLISQHLEDRTGKQVRERYINTLDRKINRLKWTEEEDTILLKWYYSIGPKWSEIAMHLTGRPENMVKKRFYSHIRKNLMSKEASMVETMSGNESQQEQLTEGNNNHTTRSISSVRMEDEKVGLTVNTNVVPKFDVASFLDEKGRIFWSSGSNHVDNGVPPTIPEEVHSPELKRDDSISRYLNMGSKGELVEQQNHDFGSRKSYLMEMEPERNLEVEQNLFINHNDILASLNTPQKQAEHLNGNGNGSNNNNGNGYGIEGILEDPLIQKLRTNMGMEQSDLVNLLSHEETNGGFESPAEAMDEESRKQVEAVRQLYLKEQLIRSLLDGIRAQMEQLKKESL